MLSASTVEPTPVARAPGWITLVLGVSTILAVGFGGILILGREDNESLESPLMLSIARQRLAGPWELYGPFGASNPLVLIHAPLYYHAAALAAWPLTLVGLDPISAARFAGRLLSFAGLALTAVAAYHLARLGGTRARAGWWAVCLIATAPVIGVMPYSVRPDMLGVGLQTAGVFLVLRRLQSSNSKINDLSAAFAAFGLAACVKQHFVVAAFFSTALLLVAARRGRVPLRFVVRGVLVAVAIVLVVYGTEELATAGRMAQSVFLAAAGTSRVHPADWMRVGIVVSAIAGRSKGLIALLAAAGLAQVAARRGLGWRVLVPVSAMPILVIVTQSALETTRLGAPGAILAFISVWFCLGVVIPACALLEHRTLLGGRPDICLWLFLAGELAVVVLMARASTGAWVNYGIQAVVWGSVLSARALARACEAAPRSRALWPIALASLLVPIGQVQDAYRITRQRQRDREVIALLQFDRPSSEVFFVDRPGFNRVFGRLDLVYDHWLYPVFESMHLAQPRSTWLRLALISGPIRVVVNTSDSAKIDGLDQTLGALGYVSRIQVGDFYVWERVR
jgi:hypothetical protein